MKDLDYDYDALCIGAHPDDVEMGMGGTVAGMIARGLKVAIVDITDGEPTPFGSHEMRMVECREAADMLGVELRVNLGGTNRYLRDEVSLRTALAVEIRRLRPRVIFVPYAVDAHPDHIAAHSIAVAARFMAKLSKTEMSGEPFYPKRIYQFAAIHQKMVREPSFFVDISENLETKLAAARCYRSQFFDNPANCDALSGLEIQARSAGLSAGCAAAEPFYAFEPITVAGPEILL